MRLSLFPELTLTPPVKTLYPQRQTRLYLMWLVVLLLVLAGLAFHHMHDSFWYDEWRSIFNVGGAELGPFSPAQIWERIATENPWQAPAYYFILAGWSAVVGWSEFAGRTLSLLFGLLSIAALYRLGSDVWSRRVGFYAALLLGLCAFYFHFLHEMRAYTLVVLLTILLIDSYWRLVNWHGGWKTALLFTVTTAGLPYTHYFSVTTVFALALYHLMFVPKRREWWKIPALMVLAMVLFLPWLNVVLSAVTMAGADTRRFQTLNAAELVTGLLTMFGNNSPALLALLLAYAFLTRWRSALFLWTLLVGGLALMLGLDRVVRILVELKYALHLFPALALAAAVGLDALVKRGLPVGILVGIVAVACVWSMVNPAYQNMILPDTWYFPWREARAAVVGRDQPGDHVLVLLPDPSLLAKTYEPLLEHYFFGLNIVPQMIAPSPATTDEQYYALAEEGIEDAQRVWLIYDRARRPWRAGPVEETILPDEGLAACGTVESQRPAAVSLFIHEPDESFEPVARYDNLTINDAGSVRQIIEGRLPVVLGFQSTLGFSPYSFGIHVYDAENQLMIQHDDGVPAESFACRAFDIDVNTLPAGQYSLGLIVYNWETGERLVNDGGEDVARLFEFSVGS